MAEKKPVVETVKTDVQTMIDTLVEKAQVALKEFMALDQEAVDNIVHAMALAGLDKHQELARMAVEETGRGVYEDKVIKNMFATEYIWHDIKKERTVGVLEENDMEGYVEVAEPVGVICGVTPTTNPTSTTLFKCLIAVKTRNPIIFGFHPSAQKCSAEAARIVRDGKPVTVPVAEVKPGDIFLVRPGESIPVDKAPGDAVSAATVNQSGFLRCEATRVGEDTTLSQIIRMVSDAAATKAPIAKIADRVSGVFVPAVIAIAVVTTAAWLLLGRDLAFALARGISVLVISCPCALGLATPVAIMVGNGLGAKNGILFKTAASLEAAGRTQIVALDKTGTITRGEPEVTDILPAEGVTEGELLTLAAALEQKSEHPLARAGLAYAAALQLDPPEVTDFAALPGNGLTARLAGRSVYAGSLSFIQTQAPVPAALAGQAQALAEQGKTPLFFGGEGRLLGVIAVADTIKEDSPDAIRQLQAMGIRVVMLTGDNQRTAEAIGRQAGVDQVIAGVLPDGKESVIRALSEKGKVAMVGDGINDAPALTRAGTGIAIGAGTDVAIDAADVVLMNSRLSDVPAAIRLSRATLRNIHENLFWAFIYNVIGIPLAAGLLIPLGLTLNPMFGAAAMSLSSFCVVSNALRLNLFQLHSAAKDKAIRPVELPPAPAPAPAACPIVNQTEVTAMKKTIKIEGMMCGHCEATVKKALEALPQVDAAQVSHTAGTAVVTLNASVADDVLTQAVEAKDYKVTGIE